MARWCYHLINAKVIPDATGKVCIRNPWSIESSQKKANGRRGSGIACERTGKIWGEICSGVDLTCWKRINISWRDNHCQRLTVHPSTMTIADLHRVFPSNALWGKVVAESLASRKKWAEIAFGDRYPGTLTWRFLHCPHDRRCLSMIWGRQDNVVIGTVS